MHLNPLWRALRRAAKPTLALLQDELRGLPLETLRALHAWLSDYIASRRMEL
jgi:hypothetical protein